MPPSSGQGATFTLTADGQQAISEFRRVTTAAVDVQKQVAAGDAGSSPKFLSGLQKYAATQAKELQANLELIERSIASLKNTGAGSLPANLIPGFRGGTAAEAVQFAGRTAKENIATEVGTRAAKVGIPVPDTLVRDLTAGIDRFGVTGRGLITSLNTAYPKLSTAIGTTRQVQFGSLNAGSVKLANTIQQNVSQTLQAAAQATQQQNATNRLQAQAQAKQQATQQGQSQRAQAAASTSATLPLAQAATGSFFQATAGVPTKAELDAITERNRDASQARINTSTLRGPDKTLDPNVFQAANDVIVDFRNDMTRLFTRDRAGEHTIDPNSPEWQPALTGALQNRRQAFDYVEGKRASDPNSVVDINSTTTAVTENGITRIFKAMQDGERETIQFLPEFERNAKKLRKIIEDVLNFDTVAANRAANPRNVIPVSNNQVVDYTSGVPVAYKQNTAGLRELTTNRDTTSPLAEAQAVMDQRLHKTLVDAERAIRPQDFVELSNGFFADIGGKLRTIYGTTGEGYDQLDKATKAWATQDKALSKKIKVDPLTGDNVLRQAKQVLGPDEEEQKYFRGALAQDAQFNKRRQAILDRAQVAGNKLNKEFDETAAQRRNFATVEANQRADPSKVFAVKGGRVDYTSGQPEAYKDTKVGLEALTAGSKGFKNAVEEGEKQLQQQWSKMFLDAERALHPEQFIALGNGFFADISNQQRTIYEITERGYQELAKSGKVFAGKMAMLGDLITTVPAPLLNAGDNVRRLIPRGPLDGVEKEAKLRADAAARNLAHDEAQAHADNEARNATILRNDTGGLKATSIPFGNYVADVRGDILELYKHTGEGFKKLARDSEEFATAQSRLIKSQKPGGGVGASILKGLTQGGFGGGDDGGILEGLAHSGATTVKYAALGTLLFGLTAAAKNAFTQFADFNDSITELQVAFGNTDTSVVASQGYLDKLSDSAAEAGSNVGEAMDVAASAVRAFGNQTSGSAQQSTQQLQDLSATFAREASRIAILTKTTLTDAAGNLTAIDLGFGVDPQNSSRVTDALANAKLVGGGNEKETGQGLANISVAAKEAGFTLEETGNIISDIIAKTDQGGELVAQRLSKAFSIVGGTAGQNAIRQLNAQLPDAEKIGQGPNVTTADQVKELSAVYGKLDDAQRKTLINQLGGTANARELIILLQDASKLTDAANLNSAGKGAKEYEERLKNIRAILTQIKGNVTGLITAVGNSGLLAPLGPVLEATLELTKAVRKLVEAFDAIPNLIKTIAGGLVGLLITIKAIQAVNEAGGTKGFLLQQEAKYRPDAALARQTLAKQRADVARLTGGPDATAIADAAAAKATARADRLKAIKDAPGQPLGPQIKGLFSSYNEFDKKFTEGAEDFFARAKQNAQDANKAAGGGFAGARAALNAYNNTSVTEPAFGPQPAPVGGLGERISGGLSSGRAQLNGIGLFGAIGLAGVGVSTMLSAKQAGDKINEAVKQFGTLKTLPDSFGVEDLQDSAANLRSAAAALKGSSSGFFGTIINALEGDPTGHLSQQAKDAAASQTIAAATVAAAQKKAQAASVTGNVTDLASQFDLSSTDALSSSLQSVGSSGRNAVDTMAAFQLALKNIQVNGDRAATSLNTVERAKVAAAAGAGAVARLNSLKTDADVSGLVGTSLGAKHGALAAGLDTAIRFGDAITKVSTFGLVRPTDATDSQRSAQGALKGIDPGQLTTKTIDTVADFQNKGLDINTPEGQTYLKAKLQESYKTLIPDPKVRAKVIQGVIGDTIKGAKAVTSVTDSSASFADLAAAIPALAKAAGAEKAVNAAISTGAGKQLSQSSDLTNAQEVLSQLQEGRKNLLAKAKESGTSSTELDKNLADINAAKVAVATATVANMQGQFQLLEASKPSENTTQAIKDQLTEINKELAVAKSDADRQALATKKAALLQQLPASQIADKFAGQRARVDSRDTIALDKINQTQVQAELDDYKKRGVTGKALADKQVELADAKRKTIQDEADLALARKVSSFDPNSAVDSATANTLTAKENLDKQLKGTAAYVTAQTAYANAQKAAAVADLAASQVRAQLSIDLSNPVQAANQVLTAAEQNLALARKDKESPDVINAKRLDVRNAHLQKESAAFQQFLTNAQNADSLGDISHKAFLNLLQGRLTNLQAELALMDPKSNGAQQLRDQIIQLRQSLKAGADALSGQFNLGDIKIPTPYEVRRAIQAGGAGTILGANSPTGTAGNVTNDNSTRNVVLNGVPIQQVLSMIEDLFGVKARTRASRRVP